MDEYVRDAKVLFMKGLPTGLKYPSDKGKRLIVSCMGSETPTLITSKKRVCRLLTLKIVYFHFILLKNKILWVD